MAPLVFTPLEFVSAVRRTDTERVPAASAGHGRLFGPGLGGVQVSGGVRWRTGYLVRTNSSKNTENPQPKGNSEAMGISAVLLSGEPMNAF